MNSNNRTFADNVMLSVLMTVSPLIVCADTLRKALVMIYVFSAVTFLTVAAVSFVPKNTSCSLRTFIYALTSSVIYIPVKMSADALWHESVEAIGIYLPLLAVNFLVVNQSESIFLHLKKTKMITALLAYLTAFDGVVVITAVIREFLAYGTVNSLVTDFPVNISGISQPFGGFICLGLLSGIYRRIRGGNTDVSDK